MFLMTETKFLLKVSTHLLYYMASHKTAIPAFTVLSCVFICALFYGATSTSVYSVEWQHDSKNWTGMWKKPVVV